MIKKGYTIRPIKAYKTKWCPTRSQKKKKKLSFREVCAIVKRDLVRHFHTIILRKASEGVLLKLKVRIPSPELGHSNPVSIFVGDLP